MLYFPCPRVVHFVCTEFAACVEELRDENDALRLEKDKLRIQNETLKQKLRDEGIVWVSPLLLVQLQFFSRVLRGSLAR